MAVFELVLTLLLVGAVLAALARRFNVPYPALLALAGAALALLPDVPSVTLDPKLALTLLVAPVLLDAAFDSSPRDLKRNWRAVTGLALAAGGPRRVTGIRCSSKRGGDTTLAGALAVDASGRGSKAPAWLRALGLEPPEEIVVDSLIGYASRWYEAPPPGRWPQNWWWKGIWVDPVPPAIQKGGALFPVEDGQLLLTVAGLGPDVPPADEASLEAFLRGFRTTVLADAVALAKPISKVFSYRQMPNRWRRFERWSERLAGFVVIGDSACAFNPIYAQGMSVAACVAGILADCCRRSGPLSPQLPSAFAKAQAKFLSGPWALATGADFRNSTTAGRPPLANKLLAPYLDAFFETAFDDPTLSILFEEVSQMLRPATAMMHPSVVARVLMRRLNPFVRRRPRDPAVLPPAALVFHDLPPRWLERHAGAAVAPSFSES